MFHKRRIIRVNGRALWGVTLPLEDGLSHASQNPQLHLPFPVAVRPQVQMRQPFQNLPESYLAHAAEDENRSGAVPFKAVRLSRATFSLAITPNDPLAQANKWMGGAGHNGEQVISSVSR